MIGDLNLSVWALVLSVLAVAVSTLLALGQFRSMRQANHLPAVVDMFKEFQDYTFHDDIQFVCDELTATYSPELGVLGLPEDARRRFIRVTYLLHRVGFVARIGVLDRPLTASVTGRAAAVWAAAEPYVAVERKKARHGSEEMLSWLEWLAKQHRPRPGSDPL